MLGGPERIRTSDTGLGKPASPLGGGRLNVPVIHLVSSKTHWWYRAVRKMVTEMGLT
jgi:hypothetical protein